VSTSELSDGRTGRPDDIKAVPVRRPGRWVASAIVLVLAASIVRAIATNKGFQWDTVRH
jgi:polar amino acid transport system permease protein